MKKESSSEKSFPSLDHSPKLRKPKSREISSRFLSPTSVSDSSNQTLSPIRRKLATAAPPPPPSDTSTDARKHRSVKELGSIFGGSLWPSSNGSSNASTDTNKIGTLADHLGNERLNDLIDRKSPTEGPQFLGRQRSCTEFSRFDKEKESSKENRPIIGGSMRYTGRLHFPGRSSKKSSSSSSSSSASLSVLPGRLSVDASSLQRRTDSFLENLSSESECSTDTATSSSIWKHSSIFSSSFRRTSGVEVSSRYLNNDPIAKLCRGVSDSHITPPVGSDNSQSFSNLPPKSAVKRASSMKALSQWALSPGRSGSPPMSVENKGKPVMSFSKLKPPHSPSRGGKGGVGNLISMGLDLFKSKKSSTSFGSSLLGPGIGDDVHQLRLLHNRLIQWRYVNARGVAVNEKNMTQVESTLLNAWNNLSKLQVSVVQKKIQFGKEKLEFRLNNILKSEFQPLQSWGEIERQHLSAISTTTECLHSIVCRVPLIEGAKVDPQPTSLTLRHASDLTASIKTMLINFTPMAQRTASLLTELSEVVSRENLLIEECFELIGMVSALEIQERNLRCSIMQLKSWQQQLAYGVQQKKIVI